MFYSKEYLSVDTNKLARIKQALIDKKFRIISEQNGSLVAERGSKWAGLYSFDIRKFRTILTIEPTQESRIICKLDITTKGAILTPDDKKKLDQDLNEILVQSGAEEVPQSDKLDERTTNQLNMYSQKSAMTLISMALISFFIIPMMGFIAATTAIFTLIFHAKNNPDKKLFALYVLAIVLGLSSYILAKIINQ